MTKGLGRGLSSLIPSKPKGTSPTPVFTKRTLASSSVVVRDIQLDQIDPNPLQPRQQFDEKTLDELAQSIAQYGLLEPIVVTPTGDRWTIVAGERRFRAHKKLQRKTIPAIVRSSSELERLELALIENIQREDLNPMERARGLAKLVNDFGLTQEEAAKKMAMARSTLANTLRLLDLPTDIQLGLAQGKISEGHAKVLLGLESSDEQMNVYRGMTVGSAMSVRDLAVHVQEKKQKSHATPATQMLDREMRAVEDRLQGSLGTKVKIHQRGKGARTIVIETYSDEEFKQVIRTLSRR